MITIRIGGFVAAAGMAAILLPSRADEPKPPANELCRFTLGAIFQATDIKNRDRFLEDCALDLKQVTKAFDACKLTVVKKPKKGKDYDDLELAIDGKQSFVLKDKKMKDVFLDAKRIRVVVDSINSTKKPARYKFTIAFELEGKHTLKLLGVVEGEHSFTWGFISPNYGYDAEGKTFDPAKIDKD
ncbi:hypothetical protein AYO40_01860 [Planctomycetaceae bacterium SCGC AG-212-D15]|nr:hypothetical protein AYO40_01860 [Planctomycetaceae bacterium SCGC AG-212-D15]